MKGFEACAGCLRWLPFSVFCVLISSCPAYALEIEPLQVKNRFPLYLMFLTPKPSGARLAQEGLSVADLSVDYSSIYFHHQSRNWEILYDMEMIVMELSLIYGIGPRAAIEMDLPFAYMGDGFLDGFLENYHEALQLNNYGREKRPKNEFAYVAAKNGQNWTDGRSNQLEPADMTVSAQVSLHQPVGEHGLAALLKGSIKLPTGDADAGFGSGAFDYGVFLPVQWTCTSWSWYLMPGLVIPGEPESADVPVGSRESASLFIGTAFHYTARMSLLAQLNYFSSPLERTGIDELDDGALELGLGFQYAAGGGFRLHAAFCEDLLRAAPDFTVHFRIEWRDS